MVVHAVKNSFDSVDTTMTTLFLSGKFIGVYFPSVYVYRQLKSESAFLGSLLNMRGVTEIILMKIFLEIEFISLRVFTIFVVSSLLTTWYATSLVFFIKSRLSRTRNFKSISTLRE
jgi:Kef-type K+ transport system membrane component KefB